MRIQIVHDKDDLPRISVPYVNHTLYKFRPVDSFPVLGDFHMSPSTEELNFQKYFRNTITEVFVIVQRRMAWRDRNRRSDITDQLLTGFVHAYNRILWIIRSVRDLQDIFLVCYKARILIRRNLPVLAPVRLKFVFLKIDTPSSENNRVRFPALQPFLIVIVLSSVYALLATENKQAVSDEHRTHHHI